MINDKQRKDDGVYRCVPQKAPSIQYYGTGEPLVIDWFENMNYIVLYYEDDGITVADEIYFADIDKAIKFAKLKGWNRVVDRNTNEIVYKK